jgi:hypothetical protein
MFAIDWLHDPKAQEECLQEEYRIWGDFNLYEAVIKESSRYNLKSSDWWDSDFSPSSSSIRRAKTKKPLLKSYKFVICDETKEGPRIVGEEDMYEAKECQYEAITEQYEADALENTGVFHDLNSKHVSTQSVVCSGVFADDK